MITLKGIRQKRGYTGYDHLLKDGPLEDLIGEQFGNVADLKARVNDVQARTQDRRCARPPIVCRIRFDDGDTEEVEA